MEGGKWEWLTVRRWEDTTRGYAVARKLVQDVWGSEVERAGLDIYRTRTGGANWEIVHCHVSEAKEEGAAY